MASPQTRLGFVCVQNAGRSQMATAFAERERTNRRLGEQIEILTGGTDPADRVHRVVVEVMQEIGIDFASRRPRRITAADLSGCDIVAAMGCSTLELDPAVGVAVRDWALDDPAGKNIWQVREIRDEIEALVVDLFDEIEPNVRREPTTN